MKNKNTVKNYTIQLLLAVLFIFIPFVSKADSAIDYNAQYQAVQEKLQPLEKQYNVLEKQSAASNCKTTSTGQMGGNCEMIFEQEGAISEYETAIQTDFITPVTNTSVTYENKLDDLDGQIFQIKMSYYQDAYNVRGTLGGAASESLIDGQIQQLASTANNKISAIKERIQETLAEYQNALNKQQDQQLLCQSENAYVSNDKCVCNSGYAWNAFQTTCVATQSKNIISPLIATNPAQQQADNQVQDVQPTQIIPQPKIVTPIYKRNLTLGSKGDDVTTLQKLLISKGLLTLPKGATYGSFGSLTRIALKKLQAGWKLPATGILDVKTRLALNLK